MTKKPTPTALPRLIRPTKDGEEGGWSYLFHVNGQDFIFPAQVDELGSLQPLVGGNRTPKPDSNPLTGASPADDTYQTKVIYWKASDWETKLLPHAVSWLQREGFTFPPIPYQVMEFRKIEDRDGEDRVTEVVNVVALEPEESSSVTDPTLMVHQFKSVEGEEGKGRRPLLQWWQEGIIYFRGRVASAGCWSVPRAAAKLADWGRFPGFVQDIIENEGLARVFKMVSLRDGNEEALTEDELRVITMWVAFCRYITSLKTTYEEGLTNRGRRRSEARTLDEAVALEQATIFKTVDVLKSGVQRKPVNTGTGTKHRYRYLVRGHERIINGKVIWVKPQIRGEGEFLARSVGTSNQAAVAGEAIAGPQTVNVMVPADGSTKPPTRRHRALWLDRMLALFRRLFPSRP
jgi:hypothetical protein